MASLSGVFSLQQFTDLGAFAVGGRIYTYAPSTTTQKTAYTDQAGTIAHIYTSDGLGGQYIALNARGELPAPLWLTSGGYDITYKTAAGVTVWTRRAAGEDDTAAARDVALRAELLSVSDASDGAGMVGFAPSLSYPAGTVGWAVKNGDVILNNYQSVDTTGATDCTPSVQAIIDANKGKHIVFGSGGTFKLAGLILSGSTYDGTRITIDGDVIMAPSPSALSTNFQSAFWAGIVFHNTARCGINITGSINGNRANQPDYEFVHALVLAGVTDFVAPQIIIREIRGDGLYISQATVTSSSANPRGISIGQVHVANTANDGRNAVSVISADQVSIGKIYSYQVGGVVNGVRMPGGFDVEADASYQSVNGLTVGEMVLVGAGTTMLGINGAGGFQNAQNIIIGSAVVVNTNAPNVQSELSAVDDSTNYCAIVIQHAYNVRINSARAYFSQAWGDAVFVQNADDVHINCDVYGTKIGAQLGSTTAVTNSTFNIRVNSVTRFGILTGDLTNCTVAGRVNNLVTGKYSTKCAVIAQKSGGVQTKVTYSVDVPYNANWTRTYRQDISFPVTFTDTRITNCSVLGWGVPAVEAWGDMPVPRVNVAGLTDSTAMPTGGYAMRGDFVRNTLPTLSAGKVTLGWTRLVSGSLHVLNTDWAAAVCPNA